MGTSTHLRTCSTTIGEGGSDDRGEGLSPNSKDWAVTVMTMARGRRPYICLALARSPEGVPGVGKR